MNFIFIIFFTDDKDQKKSQKILGELENIDDDCDQHNIAFVKISDLNEAKEYGIESLPTLVFFEKKIPHIYEGDFQHLSRFKFKWRSSDLLSKKKKKEKNFQILSFTKNSRSKSISISHRGSDERGSAARMATASEEAHRDTGSDGRDDGQADWDLAVPGSPVL